jgi:hypothetical protein
VRVPRLVGVYAHPYTASTSSSRTPPARRLVADHRRRGRRHESAVGKRLF